MYYGKYDNKYCFQSIWKIGSLVNETLNAYYALSVTIIICRLFIYVCFLGKWLDTVAFLGVSLAAKCRPTSSRWTLYGACSGRMPSTTLSSRVYLSKSYRKTTCATSISVTLRTKTPQAAAGYCTLRYLVSYLHHRTKVKVTKYTDIDKWWRINEKDMYLIFYKSNYVIVLYLNFYLQLPQLTCSLMRHCLLRTKKTRLR